jgi:hypothetical protein
VLNALRTFKTAVPEQRRSRRPGADLLDEPELLQSSSQARVEAVSQRVDGSYCIACK